MGDDFDAFAGSEINISGGFIGEEFDAFNGSEVNIFGTEFFLDGSELPLLAFEAFTINDRDGAILSGTLVDGSAFSFNLNNLLVTGEDFFSASSILTVTSVPEPCSVVLLLAGCGGLLLRRQRSLQG